MALIAAPQEELAGEGLFVLGPDRASQDQEQKK